MAVSGCVSTALLACHAPQLRPADTHTARLHTHAQAVEDKIRRWEENPDAELQRAAAAREITVYFNSDVAGAPQPLRC